jgi:hypothetical protein
MCLFLYYSKYYFLYPCQREGLVRKYLAVAIIISFGESISVFWPLRWLAAAQNVDHWPVITEDRLQYKPSEDEFMVETVILVHFSYQAFRVFCQCHSTSATKSSISNAKYPSQKQRLLIKRFHFIFIYFSGPFIWTYWLVSVTTAPCYEC